VGSAAAKMSLNNPIGKLQEIHQRTLETSPGPPLYNLVESSGLAHGPTFLIEAKFQGLSAIAEGSSKKQAKTLAAFKLLNMLEGAGVSRTSQDIVPPIPDPSTVGNKVGELQEFTSTKGLLPPWYEEKGAEGPDHMRCFTILCTLGWISEVGESTTKKAAKREVAFKVLEKLKSLGEEDLKSLENPDARRRIKENDEEDGEEEADVAEEASEEKGDGSMGVWNGDDVAQVPQVASDLSHKLNDLEINSGSREQ